jgi:hypothetical protein
MHSQYIHISNELFFVSFFAAAAATTTITAPLSLPSSPSPPPLLLLCHRTVCLSSYVVDFREIVEMLVPG